MTRTLARAAEPAANLRYPTASGRGPRLSLCYICPGHNLVASAGPTRNVLSMAGALSRHADVTVIFRSIVDTQTPADFQVLEVEPRNRTSAVEIDDSATRGLGQREFLTYLARLRRLFGARLGAFDIVLEKSWLLSGALSTYSRRRGRPGVPVENFVPNPRHNAGKSLGKRLRIEVGQRIAGYHLRRAPLILAETDALKAGIARFWHVPAERIEVIGLGVDRSRFYPRDQAAARLELGLPQDCTILLYAGVVDATHDLGPAIEALASLRPRDLELHVIGDGMLRAAAEGRASARGAPVAFHGRVPHDRVPLYIAAADLCLAPYDRSAFGTGEIGYSTMKVPEYMCAGRPVVTVPSGRLRDLVRAGETGFLLENDVASWKALLSQCPARERLRVMGEAAARTRFMSWDDSAQGYLALMERELDRVARVGRG